MVVAIKLINQRAIYFCYVIKNYMNMKELSFLLPTGSGIVTFRDYKLSSRGNKALSFVSRFKTIFSLRVDFHCLVTRAYARVYFTRVNRIEAMYEVPRTCKRKS